MGARDMVIGMIALHTLKNPQVGPRWQRTCAAIDAVDAVVTLAAIGDLPLYGVVWVTALAGGSAAAGFTFASGMAAAASAAGVRRPRPPPSRWLIPQGLAPSSTTASCALSPKDGPARRRKRRARRPRMPCGVRFAQERKQGPALVSRAGRSANQDLVDVDVRGLADGVLDRAGDVVGLQRVGRPLVEERRVGHARLDQRDAHAGPVDIWRAASASAVTAHLVAE